MNLHVGNELVEIDCIPFNLKDMVYVIGKDKVWKVNAKIKVCRITFWGHETDPFIGGSPEVSVKSYTHFDCFVKKEDALRQCDIRNGVKIPDPVGDDKD